MSIERKIYLGDGVYAELNSFGAIVLTTEDGVSVTNCIVLEVETFDAFIVWVERFSEEARGKKHEHEGRADETLGEQKA